MHSGDAESATAGKFKDVEVPQQDTTELACISDCPEPGAALGTYVAGPAVDLVPLDEGGSLVGGIKKNTPKATIAPTRMRSAMD